MELVKKRASREELEMQIKQSLKNELKRMVLREAIHRLHSQLIDDDERKILQQRIRRLNLALGL